MTLAEKLTHATEAKSKLITQFRDQVGFEGLLGAYVEQVQELEEVLFGLLAIVTDMDSQTGAQLDLIGAIVGENRDGRTDASYLLALKARMLINRSSGTNDEIGTMIDLIVANDYSIEEYYPAGFVVRLTDAFTGDAELLAELISEIRAAGVKATLEYTTENDADTFTFAAGLAFLNDGFDDWTAGDPDSWDVTRNLTGDVSEVGSGNAYGGGGSGSVNLYTPGTFLHTGAIRQDLSGLVAGRTYEVVFEISYATGKAFASDLNGAFSDLELSSTGAITQSFVASADTLSLEVIATTGSSADVTIDQIYVEEKDTDTGFATVSVNEDFDSWAAGTPSGWTESVTGAGTVTEVGSGEGNGGVGSGSANFYAVGFGATASLYQDFSVPAGTECVLELDISYMDSTSMLRVYDPTGSSFDVIYGPSEATGVKRIEFTAGGSGTIQIHFVAGITGAASDLTLDWVRLYTNGGVFASALEA